MQRSQFFLMIMFVLLNSLFVPAKQAQISDELLFVSIIYGKGKPLTNIMRFTPSTGVITTFSSLENAYVLGISPDQEKIAVQWFSDPDKGEQQLCFLSREGKLQACTNNVDTYTATNRMPMYVSWSSDSMYLYYVNYKIENQTTERQFVEVDTSTGRINRIVATIQARFEFNHDFTWTSDLSVFGVLWTHAAYPIIGGARLYKVENGGMQPDRILTEVLSSKTRLDAAGQETNLTHYSVPCRFSPRGNYIAFIDKQFPMNLEPPLSFSIQTRAGNTIYRASDTTIPSTCPAWQEDETAIYYAIVSKNMDSSGATHRKYSLYKVTMPNGKLAAIPFGNEEPRFSKFIEPRLYPDSDEKYIAFQAEFDPEAEGITGVGVRGSMIGIVNENGETNYIRGPHNNAFAPFWLPPATR